MKKIVRKTAGFQKVVFDQVDATIPGGVHVDATTAKARFTDGILPAGTLLVPHNDGVFKVVNATFTASNVANAIGLTSKDVAIDDIPLVSVVIAGTVVKDALPDKEKAGVAFVKAVLPRLTFY